jgi:hemin uptake protein HemP
MSASSFIPLNESMPPKKPLAGSRLLQGNPGSKPVTPVRDNHPHTASGCDIRYRVDELLKGGREAILVHRGQEYRLRITSTGKLILTK